MATGNLDSSLAGPLEVAAASRSIDRERGAAVAKQPVAEKRQRRERGSINPDDIIKRAFELAEQIGIDNLSMPLLGKHLGVGVTSIYWYFRKKDDLLNAMTDRALSEYVFATPYSRPRIGARRCATMPAPCARRSPAIRFCAT